MPVELVSLQRARRVVERRGAGVSGAPPYTQGAVSIETSAVDLEFELADGGGGAGGGAGGAGGAGDGCGGAGDGGGGAGDDGAGGGGHVGNGASGASSTSFSSSLAVAALLGASSTQRLSEQLRLPVLQVLLSSSLPCTCRDSSDIT